LTRWSELLLVSSAFPVFEILLLSPYHDLLESPAPAFISHYQDSPDGNNLLLDKPAIDGLEEIGAA